MQLPQTFDDDAAREKLLQRADACRAQLQPRLSELLASDEELAQRFPYHRREREYDEKTTGDTTDGSADAGVDGATGQKRSREIEQE